MTLKNTMLSIAIALALPMGTPSSAKAQATDPYAAIRARLHPGQTLTDVTSVSNPGQTYAVHLPSTYRPDEEWPVLLLMDPRGRAMVPLERFREAAERLGYILVSSYNTASDTGKDLNSPAVKAMFADTPQLFSARSDRYYLVGFSGTARTAWTFAKMFEENVAGIIAFGGGLPLGHTAPWDATFAHYGAAGFFDFNYDEMIRLDENLDLRGMAHTFEAFEGAHAWGPAEVCSRSVDWMELMAMTAPIRPIDAEWVEANYQQRLAEAENLVPDRPYRAFRRYEAILEDFDGIIEAAEVARLNAVTESLGSNRTVIEAIQAQDEAVARYYRYKKRFADMLDDLDAGESRPDAATLIANLEIQTLKDEAAVAFEDDTRSIQAQSARRLLAVVYVQCSFYLPRDYIRDGRPWAAVLALEVADAVRPLDLDTFLDGRGLSSLRKEPSFQEWTARRGHP